MSSVDISEYVSRHTAYTWVADQGFAMNLQRFIQTRPGQTITQADMAETVSAIIGAVFMDCGLGFAQCIRVMGQLGLSWS